MSKEQFIATILNPLMTAETIVIGDMNLRFDARDDEGATSSLAANRKAAQLLVQKKMAGLVDSMTPDGYDLPCTYESGVKVKTRPDRIIGSREALVHRAAFHEIETIRAATDKSQHHATLVLTFSPKRLGRSPEAHVLRRQKQNNPTRPQSFSNLLLSTRRPSAASPLLLQHATPSIPHMQQQ